MIVDLLSVPLVVRTHNGRKLEVIKNGSSELIIISKRKTLKDKKEELRELEKKK